MAFSATWFLQEQEGLLAQACLCNGLTVLCDVIDSLCDSAWAANPPGKASVAEVPDMKEFFQFAWADRQYVMRKRRWP